MATPMLRSRRLEPSERRALIIDAAARVFHGRHPEDITLDEVADAAGVSRPLVYRYFQDRRGLIEAVCLHNLDQLGAQVRETLTDGFADQSTLRRVVGEYFEFALANQAAISFVTTSLHHPAVKTARQRHIDYIAEAWRPHPHARLAARAFVGMLEAGTQDWLEHRDSDLTDAADTVAALAWTGLSTWR